MDHVQAHSSTSQSCFSVSPGWENGKSLALAALPALPALPAVPALTTLVALAALRALAALAATFWTAAGFEATEQQSTSTQQAAVDSTSPEHATDAKSARTCTSGVHENFANVWHLDLLCWETSCETLSWTTCLFCQPVAL